MYGNDNADTLAGIGRDLWQVPAITRIGHHTRKTATMIVQKMIIQIYMQRQDHRDEIDKEKVAPYAAVDRMDAPPEADPSITETLLENMDADLWQRLLDRYGSHLLEPIQGPVWTFKLGPIPPHPIVRPKWKSFDPAWLLPLHWYWSQISFPGPPQAMALLTKHQPVTEGVSWMELAFDCELATHTQFLHHPRSGKKVSGTTSGRDRARYFASATRQLFKMCGGPPLGEERPRGSLCALGCAIPGTCSLSLRISL